MPSETQAIGNGARPVTVEPSDREQPFGGQPSRRHLTADVRSTARRREKLVLRRRVHGITIQTTTRSTLTRASVQNPQLAVKIAPALDEARRVEFGGGSTRLGTELEPPSRLTRGQAGEGTSDVGRVPIDRDPVAAILEKGADRRQRRHHKRKSGGGGLKCGKGEHLVSGRRRERICCP